MTSSFLVTQGSKDENGEDVFNNKEITVTSSDANLMKINGYRAAVDLFTYDKDTTANLIVTFTREGVTATKKRSRSQFP